MFDKNIKELQAINVRFNIINAWFQKNIDPNNIYVDNLLRLNRIFPVGEAREEAYIEFMQQKIEEAGMTKQFQKDTDHLIECCEALRKDHVTFLQQVDTYQREVAEKFEKITDQDNFKEFTKVLDNTAHFLL